MLFSTAWKHRSTVNNNAMLLDAMDFNECEKINRISRWTIHISNEYRWEAWNKSKNKRWASINTVWPRYTSGNFQQWHRQRQEKCNLKINLLCNGLRLLPFFHLARARTLQHCRCKELRDSLLKKNDKELFKVRAARAKPLYIFYPWTNEIPNLGVVFADIAIDAKAPHSVTHSNVSPVNIT